MPSPATLGRPSHMLLLLVAALPLAMSPWFAASAVSPQLAARWSLDAGGTAALTSSVQLGFVVGTAAIAILNLADLLPARALFAVCALCASAANAALLVAPGFATALTARLALGAFLAGVYPPAMKMAATWFKERRGLAIGAVVGALALGKAGPYLVRALGISDLATVVTATSTSALVGAALVGLLYREGPFPFPRRAFHWGLVGEVLRHRETRLAIGGYLGHMWELYAMWTWLPAFLTASFVAGSLATPDHAAPWAGWCSFGALAAGGLGCVWGGWAAGRIGYARVVTIAMAASAACCVLIPFVFGAPLALLLPLVAVWGFFIVADSAQFSSMVTEAAPPHAVGTALTLQTSIGFLLTMATIQLTPVLAQAWGWKWAFPMLALGPIVGIGVIGRLREKRAN